MISTYQQAREYLESFIHAKGYEKVTAGRSGHLIRMRYFLQLLDNPQDMFPSVIVSGTSGKGSTAYLLAHILTVAGYKTGLISSPHLQKINERMQIGEDSRLAPITDVAFTNLLSSVVPIIEAMASSPVGSPVYYEILVAIALLHFSQQHVDIAVIEVGTESKFDATNLLYPVIFVLTNISLDHTAILGNTVDEIADEATYRIKNLRLLPGTPKPLVITGVTKPSIIRLLNSRAVEAEATVARLHTDFEITKVVQDGSGVTFDLHTHDSVLAQLYVSLRGIYQATNAALAIEVVLHLATFSFPVDMSAIRHALSTAFFPGRFEVRVSNGMTYVIDGAHNAAKVQAFCSSLSAMYKDKKKVFLVAFKKGKEIKTLLRIIDKDADVIIITRFVSSVDIAKNLGMETEEARDYVVQAGLKTQWVLFEDDSSKALDIAEVLAGELAGLIVMTGSLYFVGEMSGLLDARSSRFSEATLS